MVILYFYYLTVISFCGILILLIWNGMTNLCKKYEEEQYYDCQLPVLLHFLRDNVMKAGEKSADGEIRIYIYACS